MARDKAPSYQWYPGDYMSDPAVLALNWDQQGRYRWALDCSFQAGCAGIADEEQWRRWMQYTPTQWAKNRDAIMATFKTDIVPGRWVQKRMYADRQEQLRRFEQASLGAQKTNAKRWAS